MSQVQSYGIPWLRSTNLLQVTLEKVCACVIESWQQVEEDLAKEKQVAYPEIDLTVILVQLHLESHPVNSVAHLGVDVYCNGLLPCPFRKRLELYPHTKAILEDMVQLPNLSLIQCPSRFLPILLYLICWFEFFHMPYLLVV